MQRRQFLQSTAAAGAALGVGATAFAGQQDNNPWGNWTVGIQSYTFRRFNFEQAVQRIADLGVRYAEFYRGHIPTNSTDEQIKAFKNILERHNVTPIAFGVESFTNDNAANRRLFEFGRRLGVRYLSADPAPNAFESLDKLVAEFNIGIAIHPHGPVGKQLHRWYSAEVIMDAVRNHHRLIGTCLDTGHLIRSAQDPFNRRLDPAQQIRHMAARNYGLHLKDHDNTRRTDVVFGRAVLDVPGILRALREVNFQGYISVEYEANEQNPTPDVRACLDVLRDAIRRL